eukprot:14980275-Heterocapsa_arctica.AAC.1
MPTTPSIARTKLSKTPRKSLVFRRGASASTLPDHIGTPPLTELLVSTGWPPSLRSQDPTQ